MLKPVIHLINQRSKKSWVFSILLLLVMMGVVFTLLTPSQQPTSDQNKNYDDTYSSFSNVGYVGGTLVIPENLPVYQQATWEDPLLLKNQFVAQFNLAGDPEDPTLWQNDNLTIAQIDEPTRYVLEYLPDEEEASNSAQVQPTSYSDPTQVANSWVSQHFATYSLTAVSSEVEYLSGEYELVKTSKSLATLVKIPYAQTAGNYPIQTELTDSYPLILWVDTQKNLVKKVVFYPTLVTFKPGEELPTISVDEAVKNINSEKDARIIKSDFTPIEPYSLDQITSGNLTSGKIVYRVASNQLLKPFYFFKGNLTDSNNIRFEAEVVVPAI